MNTKSLLRNETESLGLTAWVARLLLTFALGSVLSGCLSHPALVKQTFALQCAPLTNSSPPKSQAVLAIRTLEVSPLFESRAFFYRTEADRYQLDPYGGFLVAPSQALAAPLRSYLRNCGAFKDVVEPGSQLAADTFLEVHISELYGDFRQSGQLAAVLSMRMLFFDAGSEKMHQPFLEKNYLRRVPLQQKTAAALVAGWNQALAQTMAEVASDLASARTERAGRAP